ncbi:MAG: 50S ribosomal protein L11 methyltransferase [Acidimicrobiia bacterium]|nr:50S ribosomal protein L11 methyltransferase [Acidimicrobiia bacterium]
MLALVVTVPANEVELASDALWALGVAAVEERAPAGEQSSPTEDHFVELWTSIGDDLDAVTQAVTRAAEGFPARWRWRTIELDPAIAESWRHHAVPTWVEHDFVVVPSWVAADVGPGVLRIDIDPGSSFGLGDHATTVLTLRLLRATWWPGATVLDVGCGSGVLSVAAARLGAPYVAAIDISGGAVEATLANARRNDVAGVVDASTTLLDDVDESFDIVLANLLAPVVVDLASHLRRVVAPSGALVVSGVLAASHDHVVDALAPMRVVETVTRDGWAALLARH